MLFIGVLSATGWVFGYIYSDTGYLPLVLALLISLGMTLISWFGGDKLALTLHGAKELTNRDSFPTLWHTIENLAITAGIPMPRIYIIVDESMNAFATGRDPSHASVAVTTGLLEHLEKTELEGVLAHELSHIRNLDIRLMTVVIVLVGAITILGDLFLRMSFFGGKGRRSNRDEGGGVLMFVGFLFLILAPIMGKLIKLAISRKREYLADASGALLTRYPEGLARALEKIKQSGIPLQRTSSATNHLWISEPSATGMAKKMSALFSTHPPIDDRIAKLRSLPYVQS